jgi:hypothetical protein
MIFGGVVSTEIGMEEGMNDILWNPLGVPEELARP